MYALTKQYDRKGLWLNEVEKPVPKANEVLIKVKRTAICGTDLHIYQWDDWGREAVPLGNTVGHEFVGHIVEVGAAVERLQTGQLVSGEGHITCGRCRNCLAGRSHLCCNCKGIGVQLPGAFAEYLVIPEQNVWLHDDTIDLDIAAIFDPLGNAVHSVLQHNLVAEDVLITGAGPIGLMAIAVCKHIGARHIVVTDINPKRLALAKTLGATATIDIRHQTIQSAVQALAMTEGFDVGLEMSGNAKALADMIEHMANGGRISLLGIPADNSAINWRKVIFNMLTIKGVYGREIYETWYKMAAMIKGGMDVSAVISHRLPYQQFQEGFDALEQGAACKVILSWE